MESLRDFRKKNNLPEIELSHLSDKTMSVKTQILNSRSIIQGTIHLKNIHPE